jgi:hypothetical protein
MVTEWTKCFALVVAATAGIVRKASARATNERRGIGE